MKREMIFSEMMESLFEFSQIQFQNQNTAMHYGSNDMLFMAEVHMVQDIGDFEGITITELAHQKGKSKSAISQMIDKLNQKGLILKEKHPGGNKQIALYLSDEGKSIYKYHKNLDKKEYKKLLDKLNEYTDEDFSKVKKLIETLTECSGAAIKHKKIRNR